MIGIEGAVRVLVAAKPVDFRKGMDGRTHPVSLSITHIRPGGR